MSISSPTPEQLTLNQRFADAVAKMRRRSRFIHVLRRALPAAIVVLLLVLVGWLVRGSVLTFLSDLNRTATVIHMTNPHFYGRDQHGRDFVVSAREAQKSLRAAGDVKLIGPDFKLAGNGDRSMRVTAQQGLYEDATKRVTLQGDVTIVSGDGTTFHTQLALIDMRQGSAVGNSPVQGSGPLGQIQASSYAIYKNGAQVVFTGQVHAHLTPRQN